MWKFVIIAVFSIIWAFKVSEGLDEQQNKHKTGCNSTIHLNNSKFNLDLHNLSTPCFWNITPDDAGPITLYFFSLFLSETDEVNVYRDINDTINGTNPLTKEPIRTQSGIFTLITNEDKLVIWLTGTAKDYDRTFEGFYSVNACSVAVPPGLEILHSPTYADDVESSKECIYRFNEIPHLRVKQVFTFEEFNMTSSRVDVEGGTFEGQYTNDVHTDFFIDASVLNLKVNQVLNSTDHFRLKIHEVDSSCSEVIKITEDHVQVKSPMFVLNNGSIEPECRWLVQAKTSTDVLGLKLDKVDFQNVLDIAAVNDGLTEISKPLLQVTVSSRNISQSNIIRASGSSLWISFKPLSYKSSFIANITEHGQGGYFKKSGELKMVSTTGDDTAFLLEVDDGEIVMLTFEDSSFPPPATLSVYDGFDTSTLLTSLHGQVKFPVLSRSSKMMIIGTNFSAKGNHFEAKFHGITPDCNHMSSLETENYILSENCNSTCLWIIPPQDFSSSVLIVDLQYISLKEGDSLKIHKLDASLTKLGEINGSETHVPQFMVPSNVGALINVTQSVCKEKKDRVVLIGHSSYIPGCNYNITAKASESIQISSPLYPDTYPVFSNCKWNISAPQEAIVHMAFQNLNLAQNHCVKVSQKSSKPYKYEGKTLPDDDLFLTGDVLVEFDSSGCNKTEVSKTLNSDLGFLLNVTVADCGAVLDGKKSGEFNTSITGRKGICIWKISVPPVEGDSVNIVSYVISKKDPLKNYELLVYDGSTVRDSQIVNNTDAEIWGHSNTLIFVYKRLNVSQSSSVLVFKYNTISCNRSMQCDNKKCMHPDWRCNGLNDCGDYSDERNCASVPIPPEVKYSGYSGVAFWLCIIAMLIIGVVLGVTVPVCYQRYRDSRYRRFHELDS